MALERAGVALYTYMSTTCNGRLLYPPIASHLRNVYTISSTVNREYLVVKIFSDSLACAKIKRTKYIRNINDNAVQGRLSKNDLT